MSFLPTRPPAGMSGDTVEFKLECPDYGGKAGWTVSVMRYEGCAAGEMRDGRC